MSSAIKAVQLKR